MKKFILVFAFLLTISFQLNAQWFWQNPLPQGYNLNDVMIFDESHIYAVGDASTFMKSTDGGINWEIKFNIASTAHQLGSVFFVNPEKGFVVAPGDVYSGRLFRTSDGGNEWSVQTFSFNLDKIFFIDELNGWIIGNIPGLPSKGKILKTTDGGLNWTESLFYIEKKFTDITFIDALNGWIIGDGIILKTTDRGINWAILNEELNVTGLSCAFVNQMQGYIAGYNGILKTIDGGLTWDQQYYDENLYFTSIEFLNDLIGFAVSKTWSEYNPVILRTTDGGTNWIPTESNNNLSSISLLNLSEIISVGDAGTIVKSIDGIDWTLLNSGDNSIIFSEITFANENVGWIRGYSTSPDFDVIYKTTDSGQVWSEQYRNPFIYNNHLRALYFVDEFLGWATGAGKIIKTSDGGDNWTEQVVDAPGYLHNICFYDSLTGLAVGTIILQSPNGGKNWNINSLPPNTDRILDVKFTGPGTIYIVGYGLGSNGYIYKSIDSGKSWILKYTSGFRLKRLFMVDELNGWASGTSSNILKTTDGGENWIEYYFFGLEWIESIYFININNGWLLRENGEISKTTDSGINWSTSLIKQPIANDLFFLNEDVGWMCGGNGTILRTNNGVYTSVEDYSEGEGQSYKFLWQNYPNPFNPSTKISWQSPVSSWQTLKIFDVLGREVATLVDEYKSTGSYEVEFNASQLQSGVYFYRLQTSSFVETKKMILLK